MSTEAATMAETSIEWCRGADGTKGKSWNPIKAATLTTDEKPGGDVGWHCEHVSEGCRNCYAEAINLRLGTKLDYRRQDRGKVQVFIDQKTLLAPLTWRKPRRIFVCSMADLFGEWVTYEMIDLVYAVMALCPQHTFIVLTKRAHLQADYTHYRDPAHRLATFLDARRGNPALTRITDKTGWPMLGEAGDWPLRNVWNGVSVEDQPTADERIPHLMETDTVLPWISYEPALGPLDISRWISGESFKWMVGGGESGPGARQNLLDWHRVLLGQCRSAGIPFFEKQLGRHPMDSQEHRTRPKDAKGGEMEEFPEDLRVREWPRVAT